MGGVNGLLDLGLSSMLAQQGAAAAAGRNTANASTPGYRRESADLAASLEGGVSFRGFARADDQILALRERSREGTRAYAESLSTSLQDLEAGLTAPGPALVDAIAQLFGGIMDLESVPTDPALRRAVVDGASDVAGQFRQAAAAISEAQSAADRRIFSFAEEATQLARIVAESNRALSVTPDPLMADRRDAAAEKLAGLLGGQARVDRDGKMRVVLDGGAVVVDGDRAAAVVGVLDPARDGHAAVEIVDGAHRVDVTDAMGSGRIAAEVSFRDQAAASSAAELDALAYDFASEMNRVHRGNVGLDGSTGLDLFDPPSQPKGAAASMSVSAGILADDRALASRGPGGALGDTAGLRALSALADAPVAAGGGNTFLGAAIQLYSDVGASARGARSDLELEEAHADVLRGLRDALSGVSPQEELTRLAATQRAHEAAVRFVSTVDEILADMLAKL
ncbi:MAG: flagellar hook-associated protein FlgK [Deltaproteobacteria bacterium]|nr:flagellar hook-associated protein FlgK [Deltaproteobacteria bacterium]